MSISPRKAFLIMPAMMAERSVTTDGRNKPSSDYPKSRRCFDEVGGFIDLGLQVEEDGEDTTL